MINYRIIFFYLLFYCFSFSVGLFFFYINFVICINFLNLARNWPQLIQHWTRIDLLFLMPPYKPPKWSLRKQLRVLLISFWTTALGMRYVSVVEYLKIYFTILLLLLKIVYEFLHLYLFFSLLLPYS